MRKAISMFVACIICLGISTYAKADNNALENIGQELKSWDFNIGDLAYVPGEGFYYGAGIDVDVKSRFFDGIPADWFYFSAGYLAVRLDSGSKGDNQFGYAGISFNAGRCISCGIEYIAKETGSTFVMPTFCKENLLKVGIFGAKKLENLGDISDGWAGAIRVSLITIKF